MVAKQVSFADIDTKKGGAGGDSIKERTITVDDVLNQSITVKKVEIVDGYQHEPLLLIHTKEHEKPIRTGSKVLIGQAEDSIKTHTDAGEEVKTGIKRVRSEKDKSKSYYTFI